MLALESRRSPREEIEHVSGRGGSALRAQVLQPPPHLLGGIDDHAGIRKALHEERTHLLLGGVHAVRRAPPLDCVQDEREGEPRREQHRRREVGALQRGRAPPALGVALLKEIERRRGNGRPRRRKRVQGQPQRGAPSRRVELARRIEEQDALGRARFCARLGERGMQPARRLRLARSAESRVKPAAQHHLAVGERERPGPVGEWQGKRDRCETRRREPGRGERRQAAFPSILAGLKIGWAFAWRTLVAAELVFGVSARSGGIGWYIFEARNDLDTATVFSGLLTVILIGLFVESVIFRALEARTVNLWGMQR